MLNRRFQILTGTAVALIGIAFATLSAVRRA